MPTLVLASNSPRRQELLRQITPRFEIGVSNVEETGSDVLPDWEPAPLPVPVAFQVPRDSHPTLWAWRKAVDVLKAYPDPGPDPLVLGADTIVIGEGIVLGKPAGSRHAVEMLQALRGTRHYVSTGYALVQQAEWGVQTMHAGAVTTAVWMRDYSDEQIEEYVATGEAFDKAGAYALQGLGGRLVSKVEGCYFSVVGFPLCEVRAVLAAAGVPVLPYPGDSYCPHCPQQTKGSPIKRDTK
jgi:septum formation protein